MNKKEQRKRLRKYRARYQPKCMRERIEKYMLEHNKALGKAKGMRQTLFSLAPLMYRKLWIKMNPVKAKEIFNPLQIKEAMELG